MIFKMFILKYFDSGGFYIYVHFKVFVKSFLFFLW